MHTKNDGKEFIIGDVLHLSADNLSGFCIAWKIYKIRIYLVINWIDLFNCFQHTVKSLSSLQWGFSSESLLTSLLCSLIQPVCIAESPINQLFGQLNCWFIMKLELIDKNCRCFCVPGCSLVRLSPPLKQCMLCEVDLHWSSKGFSRIGRSAFRNIISLHFILPLKMQLKKMKNSEKKWQNNMPVTDLLRRASENWDTCQCCRTRLTHLCMR